MKRYVALLLTVWLLFLSGCGDEEPQLAAQFSPCAFSFYHQLLPADSGTVQLIAHISVERVWDGLYAMDDFPDSQAVYMVAECTLEKVFYSNVTSRDEDRGHPASEGDTWYLWLELEEWESNEQVMRQLLETADSFVIDAHQCGPYYRPDSERWERILMEYDPADYAPDEYRMVEPSVDIDGLLSWRLIPVIDGRVDAESMEQTVVALSDLRHEMMFSIDETDPENGLYFCDGSTVEELYDGLSRYVGEYAPK